MKTIVKQGYLFIISGPSAVGKTSVINEIFKNDTSLKRIITCTTRPRRDTEEHGRDYFFMPKEDFLIRQKNGDFLEFSEVYGNYYGVMLSTVREKMNNGESALFTINWEGFLKVKKAISRNVYGFFISPPSLKDLEIRIKSRGTDSQSVINHRLSMAQEDMRHTSEYDFCFENKNVEETAENILKQINFIRKNA